jgi:hypothetical protein
MQRVNRPAIDHLTVRKKPPPPEDTSSLPRAIQYIPCKETSLATTKHSGSVRILQNGLSAWKLSTRPYLDEVIESCIKLGLSVTDQNETSRDRMQIWQ